MVGEASNGLEAATQPHVTLMDVQMPEFNGIAAISAIMAEFPQLRVAVLMAYRGDVIALQAIKARAAIFRKAHCAMNSLKPYACWRPVNSTSPGDRVGIFGSHRSGRFLQQKSSGAATCRQWVVRKEMAVARAIGEEAVKGHLRKIMDKLGFNSRARAVILGTERGLVELSQ
ncbi:hypothetical protein [Pseudomonas lopnurensis]|uniref:hypothetical protein n=1 Tax=Pseudomonas lopnurensis TaxID=1477517 RepID=UPI0028A877A7|nr:hypothetical protein [Pseudomonas lopnurensis]